MIDWEYYEEAPSHDCSGGFLKKSIQEKWETDVYVSP